MGNKISRRRANVDERYTRTQGLYEHKDVDQKKLRRLILDAKLAPCYPGNEDQITDLEECPICFLFYPSLNRSKCCCKCICTECFLQMKAVHSGRSTPCPFCKLPNFGVEYRGAKTTEEKGLEQAEEQKVIEAKIRIRQRELKDEQEQMQLRDESRQHGRFTIRPSLLRENFSSSLGCDSCATAGMAPSAVGRLHDRSSPPENTRNIVGEQHPLITEEEQHAMHLSRQLSGRGWTLPQPAGGSASVCTQRENESGSSFIQPDRDNEFDLDLEDIMVMEAIWLSIQEQNPQWQTSLSASGGYMATSGFIDCAVDMQLSIHESQEDIPADSEMEDARDIPVRISVAGGLASGLAVLAETQIQIVDCAGPVQVQNFSTTCNENSVPSIRNGAKNSARSVSVLGDLSGGEDIAEVSSGYDSSTRFNTHLDKERIYKGNESSSAVENDGESERRERLNWQDLDGNERLESWIEISLDSGRVLSTI